MILQAAKLIGAGLSTIALAGVGSNPIMQFFERSKNS